MYASTQKWIFDESRDISLNTSGGSRTSATKKEAVTLPSFQGDEKTSPFLNFPIWKHKWDTLIVEYEPGYRTTILWEHLDAAAREKYAGCEKDYDKSMERLSKYYADPVRIVACINKEVNRQGSISDGDYCQLVSYGNVLERNYERLCNLGLEHELSNTSSMHSIIGRFPRSIAEKWTEFLSSLRDEVQLKPFPEFIKWIVEKRNIWERMAAADSKNKSSARNSFYGDSQPFVKTCHGCGEAGHLKRECPKNRQNPGTRGGAVSKPRKKPLVKKFWCALHKDDESRRCFTNACMQLRTMSDKNKRVQLLTENRDCLHCCGDHKPEDCPRKDRVCGGGKDNRGCSRAHQVHELFCKEAKLCFAIIDVHTSSKKEETVVLLIMQVRTSIGKLNLAVFWDIGGTFNFVREAFARRCGFRGKEQHVSVRTLGGVVTEYTVILYTCFLKDENGEIQEFEAFGMETITGEVSRIGLSKIRTLFPHLSYASARKMTRMNQVDVLIGMSHPSWHPERAERAKGPGDFWIYRGKFGSCVGGRHPDIEDQTRKSDSLFTVVHSYQLEVTKTRPDGYSHHLEFCSSRVQSYYSGDVYSMWKC